MDGDETPFMVYEKRGKNRRRVLVREKPRGVVGAGAGAGAGVGVGERVEVYVSERRKVSPRLEDKIRRWEMVLEAGGVLRHVVLSLPDLLVSGVYLIGVGSMAGSVSSQVQYALTRELARVCRRVRHARRRATGDALSLSLC
eukprot:ANDGO_06969.mRNA.1 hypothetical protein